MLLPESVVAVQEPADIVVDAAVLATTVLLERLETTRLGVMLTLVEVTKVVAVATTVKGTELDDGDDAVSETPDGEVEELEKDEMDELETVALAVVDTALDPKGGIVSKIAVDVSDALDVVIATEELTDNEVMKTVDDGTTTTVGKTVSPTGMTLNDGAALELTYDEVVKETFRLGGGPLVEITAVGGAEFGEVISAVAFEGFAVGFAESPTVELDGTVEVLAGRDDRELVVTTVDNEALDNVTT